MSKEMRKASSFGVRTSLRNSAPGLLLEGEDVHLAAGGVEQDADGEGEVLLLGEVLGLLELLVLEDAAVALVEIGDEAVLVADREVDVNQVDLNLEGLRVADVDGLGFGFAGRGRARGGRGLLRVEDGGETKGKESRDEAKRAHTALDDKVGREFREKIRHEGGEKHNEGGLGCVQEEITNGRRGWRRGECAGSLLAGRSFGQAGFV